MTHFEDTLLAVIVALALLTFGMLASTDRDEDGGYEDDDVEWALAGWAEPDGTLHPVDAINDRDGHDWTPLWKQVVE